MLRKLLAVAALLPALAFAQVTNWTRPDSGSSGGGGSGTVTSVGFTGGLISVANPTTTPAFTVAGTSGGIPYFSGTSTWASSAALTANALMIGGGAGTAPSTTTTGTGILTALGVNVGSAGAPVLFNGALGTPSSGTVTNLTGTASININGTVGATTPAAGTFTSVTNSALTAGRITIAGTAGLLTDSANLTFSATGSVAGGPLATVGLGATTAIGVSTGTLASGVAGMWPTSLTPSPANYTIAFSSTATTINAPAGNLNFFTANNSKGFFPTTAGAGLTITSGTAVSAGVSALSVTRTNSNTLVDTGVVFTFIDTTSAAGAKLFEILGTSTGAVSLLSVGKTGALTVAATLRPGGFTVSGLPAAGTAGRMAYITDQLTTCAVAGAALTGGGALVCPVFDNGVAWVGN